MEIKKENNQYYAEYIESKVTSIINNENYILPDCLKEFNFTKEEIEEMNNDAAQIATYINGNTAKWVGRNCGNEKCDIIVDNNRQIELKYVGSGTGTYLNASLSYFSDKLGFVSFTEYTHKTICPILEEEYGTSVYETFSPVSMAVSKDIRHNKPELYEKIKEVDKVMRKQYTNDLFNYLKNNPDKLTLFITDCITKNINNKSTPTELIIFNHNTKNLICYNKETILQKIKNKEIKNAGLSLVFDNFRVAIGWQNGNGLNNPTFRVFLK